MHALANIGGESRPENDIVLNVNAEESLRRLVYGVASKSTKLTPSVSFSPLCLFFTTILEKILYVKMHLRANNITFSGI